MTDPRHGDDERRVQEHHREAARDSADAALPPAPEDDASPFVHPPWTLGLVLVAGVITLLFGTLVSPVWLLVGSPFVLVLALWLYVRLIAPLRR